MQKLFILHFSTDIDLSFLIQETDQTTMKRTKSSIKRTSLSNEVIYDTTSRAEKYIDTDNSGASLHINKFYCLFISIFKLILYT